MCVSREGGFNPPVPESQSCLDNGIYLLRSLQLKLGWAAEQSGLLVHGCVVDDDGATLRNVDAPDLGVLHRLTKNYRTDSFHPYPLWEEIPRRTLGGRGHRGQRRCSGPSERRPH